MSGLISGKEALIALANGEEVERAQTVLKDAEEKYWTSENVNNFTINDFLGTHWIFRIKPRTIKINGIEVSAPFEPKEGDYVYFICSDEEKGWSETTLEDTPMNWGFVQFGAWRNEKEIKQVVDALRSVFKGE